MLNTKTMAIKITDEPSEQVLTNHQIYLSTTSEQEQQSILSTSSIEQQQQQQQVGVEEMKEDVVAALVVEENESEQAKKFLEQREEELRQERVAESFYLYKKQLEAEKAGLPFTNNTTSFIVPRSNTWDSNHTIANTELVVEEDNDSRPLYWSESMDMALAKLVKECIFDFDEISIKMQELAKKKQLSYAIVHSKPYLLTSEVCRIRWSSLDANQW